MKKQTIPLTGPWQFRRREGDGPLTDTELAELPGESWYSSDRAAGVHELLVEQGVIADPRVDNSCADLAWIGESDWIYRYTFREAYEGGLRLVCKGLDTWADLYIAGRKVASCDSMFLPLAVELDHIRAGDALVLHFHAPQRVLDSVELPPEWRGKVHPLNTIRKCKHDFTRFGGQNPYLALVGPFGDIQLERWSGRLEEVDIEAIPDGDSGRVAVSAAVLGTGDALRVTVTDEADGGLRAECRVPVEAGRAHAVLTLERPALWQPRGFGEQRLYRVETALLRDGRELDCDTRSVGFRSVAVDSSLRAVINGRHIRLWGANFTPPDGLTHTWNQERFLRLLELMENAHMNLLRIWGGGYPYPDSLYEECDRRGILVWQDFIHDYSMYPDSEQFTRVFLAEAEHTVRRLRHHPSILLWCGGNETFLGAQYLLPGVDYLGGALFTRHYPALCERLDPRRYYHVNSPWGGAFANDPTEGDTHCYSHEWYVPEVDCPVFASENNRACTPCPSTMERMLGDGLWPEGYRDEWTRGNRALMPESWKRWMVPAVELEAGDLQNYDDATSGEELMYKFGAAARDHILASVEGCRRGKRTPDGERISNGHMIWKLNDTWPSIYCGAVDYYLQPNMSYYALRRAYRPVALSFRPGSRMTLWGINDSPRDVAAALDVQVYDMEENRRVDGFTCDIALPAGESLQLDDLRRLGQIRRRYILVATLTADGAQLDQRVRLLDIERRCRFPAATVTATERDDGSWLVETDRYAHCVCLRGQDNGGNALVFNDNYFSLLPGDSKVVRAIDGARGRISVKDAYAR